MTTTKQATDDGLGFRDLLLVGFFLKLAGRWGGKKRAAGRADVGAVQPPSIMDGYAQAVRAAADSRRHAIEAAHRTYDRLGERGSLRQRLEEVDDQYEAAIRSAQEVTEAIAPYRRRRR